MTLLSGRSTFKPFSYEPAYEFWLKQQKAHWLHTEVNLSSDVTDWKQNLNEAEKHLVGSILKGFTQVEVVVGDYWTQNVAKWFPHPEVVMAATTMGAFECFDDQTELLTASGWKSVQDISVSDRVASYSLVDGSVRFEHPLKAVAYPYKGLMHLYENSNTSICVTPNHDLIVTHPITGKTKKAKSEEGIWGRNYLYPTAGKGIGISTELSVWEKILICIQADGTIRGLCPASSETWRTCDVHLTKTRKISKLSSLLEEAGVRFSHRKRKTGSSVFTFCVPDDTNLHEIKTLEFLDLETMSYSKARDALDEILFWGGTQNSIWYNTNKTAVDKLQAICVLAGRTSNVCINRTAENSKALVLPSGKSPKTARDCFAVNIRNVARKTYPHRVEVPYDGNVYCVSVSTQNIVSRRRRRVAITGNTIHQNAYSLLDQTLGFEDYESYMQEPTIKAKLDSLVVISSKKPSKEEIGLSLALFSAFAEGVSLFSSFAVLLNFSRFNKLKGVGQIVSWSVKDEGLHSEFGCYLFRTFVRENPSIMTDEFKKTIYEAARTTVALEDAFIDYAFSMGDVEGLSAHDLKQFIRHRANIKLGDLGFKQNWKNVDKEAVDRMSWFDYLTAGVRHTDFFVQRPTDYQKFDASDLF